MKARSPRHPGVILLYKRIGQKCSGGKRGKHGEERTGGKGEDIQGSGEVVGNPEKLRHLFRG